jgi:hypothetical protein
MFSRKPNCVRHILENKTIHPGQPAVPTPVYMHRPRPSKRTRRDRRASEYLYDYHQQNNNPNSGTAAVPQFNGTMNPAMFNAAPGFQKKPHAVEKWADWWKAWATIVESMEKISKAFTPQPSAGTSQRPPAFPAELIVSKLCERCHTIDYFQLPDPFTGSYEVKIHKCVGDKALDPQDLQNLREKISPERTLRRMVDRWLLGYRKYLIADIVSSQELSAIPEKSYLVELELDLAQIVTDGRRVDKPGNSNVNSSAAPRGNDISFIIRAVRAHGSTNALDPYGWIVLAGNEVLDFLRIARATALICRVKNYESSKVSNDPAGRNPQSPSYTYYHVRIVPPYQVAARQKIEQNEQLERMRKEMIKEMLADLESGAEEEEDEDMDEHEENSEEGYLAGREGKSQASALGKPEKVVVHQQPEEDGQSRQAAQKAQKSPERYTTNKNGSDKENTES